ncbi:MAG: hypothetical protein KatS3mg024_0422 [Armatimonadota bacterium]|nr:MAG: hypothetical protein KatS3mg024_0422 [Armatimonadota bacterium]
MNLAAGSPPGAFHYPPGATAALAARAQLELWGSSEGRRLYPYFALLETHIHPVDGTRSCLPPPRRARLLAGLFGWYPSLKAAFAGAKPRCDVLIVGECRYRQTEYRLMSRIVCAVAETGRSVLYLVCGNDEERAHIQESVRCSGREDRVTLMDLPPPTGSLAARVMAAQGRLTAYEDWHKMAEILPGDLELSDEAYDPMAGIAAVRRAWHRLRETLEFETAIVRCHFTPLGASIAESELDRPTTVTTTQHGVICSPTWFPILADRYICFGPASAAFAKRLDTEIAQRTSRKAVCADYLPSGSLYDALPTLRPQRQPRTLLVIDQNTRRGSQLLGMHEQNREFPDAVERALERCRNLDRVIIRPHPDNKTGEGWQQLLERYPGKVEFSPQGSSLENNLAVSSVVAGMFSGAVVTAAACGLPALFVWREGWYYTGDIECFRDPLFTHPDDLPEKVDEVLSSPGALEEWAAAAKEAARQYYQDGGECRFDRQWAERVLAPVSR